MSTSDQNQQDNPELLKLPQVEAPNEAVNEGISSVKSAGSERNPEFDVSNTQSGQQSQATVQNIATAQAAPSNAAPTQTPPPPSTNAGSAPLIADDTDLIEKEWVEKAKQIVDQTKADPHKQNKEINKFKADYIKKRYNKDLPLNES